MFNLEEILRQKGIKPYTGEMIDLTEEGEETGENIISPYIPPKGVKEAVNLMLLLEKRPLLLKGEPGCGKTTLAIAVANVLGAEFFRWDIKSTTRAKDGLYRYDAVKRLQDTQLANSNIETIKTEAMARLDTSNLSEECDLREGKEKGNAYLQYGALGKAFCCEKQAVVLIDEIDKADIDFPNDLLQEIDEGGFFIEEIGKRVNLKDKKKRPFIFVTSNDEKDLPDAFLRRCLFHYIEFPTKTELEAIVQAHFPQTKNFESTQDFIELAVKNFIELREKMQKREITQGKKVTTSELLDWYKILICDPQSSKIALESKEILFPEVLLKRLEDIGILEDFKQQQGEL